MRVVVKEQGKGRCPRETSTQAEIIRNWNNWVDEAGRPAQPVMQSLYINLVEDPDAALQAIHLGFRSGAPDLLAHLKAVEQTGLYHIALFMCFNQANIDTTLKRVADEIQQCFTN